MRTALAPELRRALRRGAGPYGAGAALLLLTNALALTLPWLLRRGVDGLRSGVSLEEISRLAILMAAAAGLQALLRLASRRVILGYCRRVVADVRERLQAHLLLLPPSFYDRARVGDLMSRAINDLRALRNFFGPGVLSVLNAALLSGASLVMMLWLDPLLCIVALAAFPPFVPVARRVVRRIYRLSHDAQERLADLTARVEQGVMGQLQIKAFSQEERELAALGALSETYRDTNLSLARARGRMAPLGSLLAGLGALAVLGVGGWQVARGVITLGDFVAFNVLIGLLSGPTITLGWTLDLFQRGQVAALRIQQILDEPIHPAAGLPATSLATPPETPRGLGIEVRDLEFTHARSGRGWALRGINLSIRAGEHVGITGPVGSGKSTLLALLAGLYAPSAGRILVDGVPLPEWPIHLLRRAVVLAPQEAFLFSRTLADNVRLGRPEMTDAAAGAALEQVAFGRDLAAMPAGLGTLIGERGLTVSGGQRQRVALARTLAVQTPVVLLDDPLSMVDADTESQILKSLEEPLRGRTLLLATHRPALLARMDRVLLLEGGQLAGESQPESWERFSHGGDGGRA